MKQIEPTITGTQNGVFLFNRLDFLDVNSNTGSYQKSWLICFYTRNIFYILYNTGTCSVNSSQSLIIHSSISWANLQWPPNGEICPSGSFDAFGRIFVDNVTQGAGAGQNITAEIGYSTSNTNPNLWTNWVSATYNTDYGNNDEYKGTLSGLSAGTYYYAFIFTNHVIMFMVDLVDVKAELRNMGRNNLHKWSSCNSPDASFTYPQCCYFSTDTDPTPIPTVLVYKAHTVVLIVVYQFRLMVLLIWVPAIG